jgi:diaminopropionate ammonia-lyase
MQQWKPPILAGDLFLNPRAASPESGLADAAPDVLDTEGFQRAIAEIKTWPDYRPTPLHALPGMARALGLGAVWYKDEGQRFGLGSFKAAGGAYAVLCFLREKLGREIGAAEFRQSRDKSRAGALTVATATDGNHGRAVAWGARQFGCRSVIYLHADVSPGREKAIAEYGAEIRRVAGNYDDSVRVCQAEAKAKGWQVISDTSWPGYEAIPRHIMHGYGLMMDEALGQLPPGQLPPGRLPSHVFIQAGVGGLAGAVSGYLWLHLGKERPRIVVVEPDKADCHFRSAQSGRPTRVEGKLDTLMAGLAAGEVSPLAWRLLDRAVFAFQRIEDQAALVAMRALAMGIGGDPRIVGGEAGVGGLAGLIQASGDATSRAALALGPESSVLLIGSEGATDPALYADLVGRSHEAVMAS